MKRKNKAQMTFDFEAPVRTEDRHNPNAPRDLIRDPFTPAELAALADAATKRAKEKHD